MRSAAKAPPLASAVAAAAAGPSRHRQCTAIITQQQRGITAASHHSADSNANINKGKYSRPGYFVTNMLLLTYFQSPC
jgi:hypothetical protein